MPALEQLPPVSAAILDDLRRIVRVLRESSRAAEQEVGVSGAQLFVLRALAAAGTSAPLSLNALSARTRTHQSTVSVVVKRLVERGLVSRSPSPDDARCLQLRLTRRGQRLLERAPLAAQDRLIHGIERMPAEQQGQLAAALHALVTAMQLGAEPPQMFFEEAAPVRGGRKRRESTRAQPE